MKKISSSEDLTDFEEIRLSEEPESFEIEDIPPNIDIESTDTIDIKELLKIFGFIFILINIVGLFVFICYLAVDKDENEKDIMFDGPPPNTLPDGSTVYHLIPHTHLDLGWLKTEEEYYRNSVRYILDNIVVQLEMYPQAKMSFVDLGYLHMYLTDPFQSSKILKKRRKGIKELIESKQLDIQGNGFVMPDLACNHYDDLLSNFQYGRHYAREDLGSQQSTLYSIDSFGISKAFTRLGGELGYGQHVVTRLPHQQIHDLKKTQDLLFKWTLKNKIEDKEYSMPHLDLAYHYAMSTYFPSFEYFSHQYCEEYPESLKDLIDYLDFDFQLFAEIYENIIKFGSLYKSPHVYVPYGNDFSFSNSDNDYNYLAIILLQNIFASNNLTGRYQNIVIRISTLTEYFDAVKASDKETPMDLKNYPDTKDFMPLVENGYRATNRASWTGYYATNPVSKRVMKVYGQSHRALRSFATRLILTSDSLRPTVMHLLKSLKRAEWVVSANTHHDAITGTSRNYVANHYLRRMYKDNRLTAFEWRRIIKHLVKTTKSDGDSHKAYIYEDDWPPELPTEEMARVFLKKEKKARKESGYDVRFAGADTETIEVQSSTYLLVIPEAQNSRHSLRVVSKMACLKAEVDNYTIEVDTIPLKDGLSEYLLRLQFDRQQPVLVKLTVSETAPASTETIFSSNDKITHQPLKGQGSIKVKFRNGKDLVLTDEAGDMDISVGLYKYVFSSDSSNQPEGTEPGLPVANNEESSLRSPGKYLMVVTQKEATFLTPSRAALIEQSGKDRKLTIIKLRYNDEGINLLLTLDSWGTEPTKINVRVVSTKINMNARDLIVRYSSGLSQKTFFTDSNGLEALERTMGANGQFIECNFYPVVSTAWVEDSSSRVSVLVDRAEGVSMAKEGALDFLIDHVTISDDKRGAGERAYEGRNYSITHELIYEKIISTDQHLNRKRQVQEDSPPLVFNIKPLNSILTLSLKDTSFLRTASNSPNDYLKISFDTDGKDTFIRITNFNDMESYQVDLRKIIRNLNGLELKGVKAVPMDLNGDINNIGKNGWPRQEGPLDFDLVDVTAEVIWMEPMQIKAFKLYV